MNATLIIGKKTDEDDTHKRARLAMLGIQTHVKRSNKTTRITTSLRFREMLE